MKVTIEFTTDDDLELLESVFKARAAEDALNAPAAPESAPIAPVVPSTPVAPAFAPAPPDMFGVPPATPGLLARDLLGVPPAPRVDPGPPGDRDSEGLPWDGRIHSSSKALLADGKWRQRRNTDPAVVAAVTAELRAALAAPSAPVPAAPPAPPAPPPAAVVPPPPEAPASMTFPQFMHAITAARLAPGVVLEACKAVGMPSIPALAQRTDLIPAVATALGVAS